MKRTALSLAVLGLLAFGAPAAPAQEQEQIRLGTASERSFPEISLRLTVPERRGLQVEDLKVTENGDPVSGVELASADGGRAGEFGSMLVIDTSKSMHGGAIRSAIEAARALARQRRGSQQLGIILFNGTSTLLLAPTDDQRAIDKALSKIPKLAPQTHIFDAVDSALDVLAKANITAASIVVLSDGADSGSAVSAQAVARRARAANVSVHTVGLRSNAFDTSELTELASRSGGRYVGAESTTDVRRIFRDLGAQLSSDYLLRYSSVSRPGRAVTIAVRVEGVAGVATSSYRVPGGATFVQVEPGFWTSGLGLALTAFMFFALVALALGILLVRRTKGPTVRERVRGFVSTPEDEPLVDTVLSSRTSSSAERSLERTRWWAAFKQDLEIGRIEMAPMRIVTVTTIATLLLAWLLVKISGFALVGLFALAIPWGARLFVRMRRDRQRAQFTDQLPDLLQGAASAIRAGHGLVAALSMVAEDAPEPSRLELRRVVSDEALGVPLDEALRVVQQRMGSKDVMQIALVAQIQRDAGGNMAEVLDRITESLRQRAELRRMIQALTAQGRMSRWIVTSLPVALLLVISVLNPRYVEPLYTETLGLVMLVAAGIMMAMGSMVIGKIVNFKV